MTKKITKERREAIELACCSPLSDEEIQDFTEHVFHPPHHRQCGSPTPSQGCSGACAPKGTR